MDYATLINSIRLIGLNNPVAPVAGTNEYNTYAQMINSIGILSWENERGVLWNELWVDEPNYVTITAQTPDTTGITTPPAVSLPDDFKFIGGGFVRITYPQSSTASIDTQILPVPIKMLPEIELNPYANIKEFYITGNNVTGYNLQYGWTPQAGDAEIGATISFRYYKTALQLANTTDIPEMTDPMYIVYKVAATVAINNFNQNLYQVNNDKADRSLQNMRKANSMASNYMDDYVKDIDQLTGSGFWWSPWNTPFPQGWISVS